VGEERRVHRFDKPGTTRDPIEVPFERAGRRYTLIDPTPRACAGAARPHAGRILFHRQALQAIEAPTSPCLLLDAADGVTEQDAHVAGYILERGRAVVVAVNIVGLPPTKEARERVTSEVAWKAELPRLLRHPD